MDSTLVTLYAEVTSNIGTAKTAFRSGQTLRTLPFTAHGEMYNSLSAAITLPALAVPDTNVITQNATMESATTLPIQMTVSMVLGSKVAVTLSPPGLTASITNPTVLRAAIRLPTPVTAGRITTTELMEGSAALPVLSVSMRLGWSFSPKGLPALAAAGSIHSNLVLSMPANVGSTIRLPMLKTAGSWTHDYVSILTGNIILPALAGMAGSVYDAPIPLPRLRVSGSISNGTTAVYQGWAMNLSNKAVSQFTSFPFRQMARAFDRYSMVGFDGNLYDLGGDTDNTTPISWAWRSGISDLNTRGLKGVLGAYIDGIVEAKVDVELVLDTGVYTYTHVPRGTVNDYKTHRVSTGRGLRSSNVGMGMAGTCYIAIDSFTPDYVVSSRNL